MNQLELILENIRLSSLKSLLTEAQTDLELIRGQRLINESVLAIRGALMEESFYDKSGSKRLGYGTLGALGATTLGGALGAVHGYDMEPEIIRDAISQQPEYQASVNNVHNYIESRPDIKPNFIDNYGTDYMNSMNEELLTTPNIEHAVGGVLGAGAGAIGGLGLVGASLRNPNKTKFFK